MKSTYFTDFINLIFPLTCHGCQSLLGQGEHLICSSCMYHLPITDYHQFPDNGLIRRFWGKVPLKYALSYLHFSTGGKVQKLLHSLKYNGAQEIGELLGHMYGKTLQKNKYENEFDLIVPIPLHKSRLRKRGYNQSTPFAKGLGESLDIDWKDDLLYRKTANTTQTSKKRYERYQNVKDIFGVQTGKTIENRRLLLVDDVITTGSTLESCAKTLFENGAGEVSIASIAAAV